LAQAETRHRKRLLQVRVGVYRDEFDRIRDFMNSGASTDGFMTRMKIADLDRKRKQDLRTVAPELAELLNYVKT
jgi:hypothetical protein